MAADINNLEAVEVLLGAAGVILAGLLLWGLHKKLKIFTKGSITFMTVVLMLVAFESIVEHLNDVRNAESSAKGRARTAAVSNFLRAWLEGREAEALELSDVEQRDTVALALRSAAERVARNLSLPAPIPGSVPWVSLIASHQNRYYELNLTDWTGFSAVVKLADGRYLMITGRVRVSNGEPNMIWDFEAEVGTSLVNVEYVTLYYRSSKCVFRNENFASEFSR